MNAESSRREPRLRILLAHCRLYEDLASCYESVATEAAVAYATVDASPIGSGSLLSYYSLPSVKQAGDHDGGQSSWQQESGRRESDNGDSGKFFVPNTLKSKPTVTIVSI